MESAETRTLYDRRVYSIATVMDDFIDRIMVDPRLNANPPVDEAHHRVPAAGFKYLVKWSAEQLAAHRNTRVNQWRTHMLI